VTLTERRAAGAVGVTGLVVVVGLLAFAPSGLIAVVALPGVAALAVLAWGALHGSRLAVLPLLFAAVFLTDAVFRIRDYADKDVDFQVFLKLAIWAGIAAVALMHVRTWAMTLLMPSNTPAVLFLVWLMATAAISPVPAYSFVAAFSIVAYVLFSAYVFATYDRVTVFAAIVAAIVAFCAISILVYFAVPEFGRYVYWLNEQRYVSARLAGIAGSANNMGRIAAFGLILVGLYARDFHRLHRLFVPVSALIMGAALLLTNSRTSLMMVIGILAAVYLLKWRRLHLLMFAVAFALIASALLLPFGNELGKLVARSGNLEEITSLTSRTDIWYAVFKLAEAQPWTGYGYASSVYVLPLHEREVGFLTSHAHNLMLQLLLTTGWIGVVLFSLSMVAVAFRAAIRRDRDVLVLLSFVLFNGVTESSGFTTLANICSVAFAIAVTLPRPVHDAESPALAMRRGQTRSHEDHRPYQRRFS
jgi:O-antigen ligase